MTVLHPYTAHSRIRDSIWDVRPWLDGETDTVRRMWDEGCVVSAIARRIGRTVSSVVGRVHRLALPGRPSPIIRTGPAPKARPAPKPEAHHSATEAAHRVPSASPVPAPPAHPPAPGRLPPAASLPERPAVFSRLPLDVPPLRTCQYPLTDGKPWRFCDQPCVPTTAWCQHHLRVVYQVPPRRLREVA